MTAGKSLQINCPRCSAPHNEHRLTCRRCGHYLQQIDDSASNTPTIPPGILGVFLVALVAGFACYILFWPKTPAAKPDAAPVVTSTQTATATDDAAKQQGTKKHKKRHHAH